MSHSIEQMLRTGTSTVFQPIFDVRERLSPIWAIEALTRGPAGTHFEPAPIFFDYVRLKREEVRVDRWCVATAFARFAAAERVARLCVNVHASTLERDAGFASFLESAAVAVNLDPSNLIVEIIEQSPYFDSSRLLRGLRDLRSLGVAIAIDDVGLGHGNYRTILDSEPEYLKIDRYFVSGSANDPRRRSLIASTVHIACDFGALVIGEGVEDPEDLVVLRSMGVPLMQGYLFAVPSEKLTVDAFDVASVLPLERREA